jgi:hypothetical protein
VLCLLLCKWPAVAEDVQLKQLGGTYAVPVAVNAAITLDFMIDTGASDVSVPADVVSTLLRTGTVASTGGPAMYFIGIDVSTKESALCIQDDKGKIVRETKLPSDPEIIARFIADTGLASERIGLESGCTAAWLFAGLQRDTVARWDGEPPTVDRTEIEWTAPSTSY